MGKKQKTRSVKVDRPVHPQSLSTRRVGVGGGEEGKLFLARIHDHSDTDINISNDTGTHAVPRQRSSASEDR